MGQQAPDQTTCHKFLSSRMRARRPSNRTKQIVCAIVTFCPVLLFQAFLGHENAKAYFGFKNSHVFSFQISTDVETAKTGQQEEIFNDSHFSNVGILDLFPWEVKSIYEFRPPKGESSPVPESPESRLIHGTGACHPPTGIQPMCCLGSFSAGGRTARSPKCTGGLEVFQRVRKLAMEFLHPNLDGGSDCDVCRILNLSQQQNLTVSFWGDSVQGQVWDGFLCELMRRNYTVVNETRVEQKEMEKLTNCKDMFCLKEIHSLQVVSPDWDYGRTAKIKFFFQYRPKETVQEIYDESFRYILEAETDVLFFNFGVHWGPDRRSVLKLRVGKVLETIHHYGKNISLLAFRETAAQHFNTTGGEWPTGKASLTCAPLSPYDDLVGWRSRLFRNMSQGLGYKLVVADPSKKEITDTPASDQQEIVIAPFLNFTRGLYDLHPGECTHFCSTPHLWYPLWRSLRLSMDWKFGGLYTW
jgi:hypothetical protein